MCRKQTAIKLQWLQGLEALQIYNVQNKDRTGGRGTGRPLADSLEREQVTHHRRIHYCSVNWTSSITLTFGDLLRFVTLAWRG